MSRKMLVILGCLSFVSRLGFAETAPSPAKTAALKALSGMSAFSHKEKYSEAISDLYLGYDTEGKPRMAVVLRSFKTYEKVTAMVVVREQDGNVVVERADIPDANTIKAADKRAKVTDAIKGITGKTVKTTSGEVSGIDATTGATRYQARIYASFDLMVRAALAELAANPDWPRTVSAVSTAPAPELGAR